MLTETGRIGGFDAAVILHQGTLQLIQAVYMGKTYEVRAKKFDDNGAGIVEFNGSRFPVTGLLPGEKAEISLVYSKGQKAAVGAELVKVTEESPERICVKCPVYLKCGGCNMLHMTYDAELKYKQDKVKELFKEDEDALILPIIGAADPLNYRHKVYCSLGIRKDGRGHTSIVSGLYEENTRKPVPVRDCMIQCKTANKIEKAIPDIMTRNRIRVWDPATGTGVLRHVYIRVSHKTGKAMVVLVTGVPEFREAEVMARELKKAVPAVSTVIHNINEDRKTGMILGKKSRVILGDGCITDDLCGRTFKISEKSFFQVHPAQAEKLFEAAVTMAGLTGQERVLDAYCGTGTIGIIAASNAASVTGVELSHDAVNDAKGNAALNDIKNISFLTGDAGEYLKKSGEKFDTVFMDPPRNGSSGEFLEALSAAGPERIIYVSCNPVTQKRDAEFLKKQGYRVAAVQAVDMFPRTAEVENIILMTRYS